MDLATVMVVAQNLLAALQSSQLKEICCSLGYKSEFEHFCDAVSAVRAVLLDVGVKQELSHEAQLLIQELVDVVYEADDLVDEFITFSEQKQLIEDGKVSEEGCLLLSRFDLFGAAKRMSQGVRKIREQVDAIAINKNQYGLSVNESVDYLPIRRKKGIHSFVCADKVIGREKDAEKIIDILCNSNVQQHVSLLSIVGMGGLGKTALARFVYNEDRIASEFPLRLWACVSDLDQHQFDVDKILVKILRAQTDSIFNSPTYSMLNQLLKQIEGRKFLLVLDDVWTENQNQWLKLVEFLMAGRSGSWIVVTTRSRKTAEVIGNGPTYELQSLSDENSWSLFEKMAFEQESPLDDLVNVGRKIVKDCGGVPLALRVVGSLLYGQDKYKWLLFQEIVESANIREREDIMPLLKLSYHHLESSFKSCFSYCALFPKDFIIEKELLISLWMAQGYIIPFDDGQSTEDAGEEYFSIMFWRCFFQDVQFDEYGEVVSCKIHALMHDLAQETIRKEIYGANYIASKDSRLLHQSIMSSESQENTFPKTCSRMYLHVDRMDLDPSSQFLEDSTCLRALVLRYSGIVIFPVSIDKMLHLRCLDLSNNDNLEVLPKSITCLHNLQTLRLRFCIRLKELPQDLSKLVKLRVLDVDGCYRLNSMPSQLGMLTCLRTLTKFPVEVSSSERQCFHQLEGLKALKHLKGHLQIYIRFTGSANYVSQGVMEGAYLKNKDGLKEISIFVQCVENVASSNYEEALLDDMQPHPNLRRLFFFGYRGVRMPGWAKDHSLAIFLPNLVKLQLSNFEKLKYLPILGSLCCLKSLSMYGLPCLEYMDVTESGIIAKEQSFFPYLEELKLCQLSNLKGWYAEEVMGVFPCFPRLKLLRIDGCPEMASALLCPSMEDLQLLRFNRNLRISISKGQSETVNATSSSCHSSLLPEARNLRLSKFRSLITDNLVWYNSLPAEDFQSIAHICASCMKLESLSETEDIFRGCSSSLKTLIIQNCFELRSISKGLQHLAALDTLIVDYLPNLLISSETEKEEDVMAWRSMGKSLRSLELKELDKLMILPTGMQYLTNLHVLKILDCPVQSLPDWMWNLTSLRRLEISNCYDLYERCQNPEGKDWYKIQHIPHVSIS